MATKQAIKSPVVIDGSHTYELGNASEPGVKSSFILQFVDTGTFSGSLVVSGRLTGSGAAYVAIPYKKRDLGGTAADDSTVSAALTAAFVIEVDASGLDIALVNTHTSGSGTLHFKPVQQ